MKVKHVTLSPGAESEVQFDTPGSKFLVKNFTEQNIKIAIDQNIGEDNYIIIPPQTAEVIFENEFRMGDDWCKSTNVYVSGEAAGEVEIRCLVW